MDIKDSIRRTLEDGLTVQEEFTDFVVFMFYQDDTYHINKHVFGDFERNIEIQCHNFNEAFDEFVELSGRGEKIDWAKEGF